MITSLFAIYDKKAQYFAKPFTSQNDATAKRLILNTINDPKAQENDITKNPEDFSLFNLGDYDDADGSIKSNTIHITDLINLREHTDETQDQSNKQIQHHAEH